jgi:hypothetical protein
MHSQEANELCNLVPALSKVPAAVKFHCMRLCIGMQYSPLLAYSDSL